MLRKDEWRDRIIAYMQTLGDQGYGGLPLMDAADAPGLAEAIAQAAEEVEQGYLSEVKALRQERDDAYAKADELEAKLAVMSEAVSAALDFLASYDGYLVSAGLQSASEELGTELAEALSAA
jgi:hypothetical protein